MALPLGLLIHSAAPSIPAAAPSALPLCSQLVDEALWMSLKKLRSIPEEDFDALALARVLGDARARSCLKRDARGVGGDHVFQGAS